MRDRVPQQWGFRHLETHPRTFSAVSREPQMHVLLSSVLRALLGFLSPRKATLLVLLGRPSCTVTSGAALLLGSPVGLEGQALVARGCPHVAWQAQGLRASPQALSAPPREESSPERSPASGARGGGGWPGHGPRALTGAAVPRATSAGGSSQEEGPSQAGRPPGPRHGLSQAFSFLTLQSLRQRSLLPRVYSVQSN